MGKPIIRNFGQSKGILKFFPYEGAACLVPQSAVSSADANGNKIVPAGTPWPYQGTVDWEKVKSLTISDAARKATPRVTFYGAPKIASI